MTLAAIGDAYQLGNGDLSATQNVGAAGSTVQVAGTAGSIGFFGQTPAVQQTVVTTLATTPTATDIATAVNGIITRLQTLGLFSNA